jgi:hypothetical protein
MNARPKRALTMAGDATSDPQPSVWDDLTDDLSIECEITDPASFQGKSVWVHFSNEDLDYFIGQLVVVAKERRRRSVEHA